MGSISKLIGSVVGAAVSWAVAKFALPAEWAGPEFTGALTVIIVGLFTYFAPANKPSA